MARMEWNETEAGGVEIVIVDDNGDERAIVFEPDDNGNIAIGGRGPSGSKRGKMDPTGNGDNPLGK